MTSISQDRLWKLCHVYNEIVFGRVMCSDFRLSLQVPHINPFYHQKKKYKCLCLPLQVMYCSSECRQAAADQYHRALCLGPAHEDPDHPINKLKEAWRLLKSCRVLL